jgi:hypothetical protein
VKRARLSAGSRASALGRSLQGSRTRHPERQPTRLAQHVAATSARRTASRSVRAAIRPTSVGSCDTCCLARAIESAIFQCHDSDRDRAIGSRWYHRAAHFISLSGHDVVMRY